MILQPNCSDYVSTLISVEKRLFMRKFLKEKYGNKWYDKSYVDIVGDKVELQMDYTKFNWDELKRLAEMFSNLTNKSVRIIQHFHAMNVDEKDQPVYVDFEFEGRTLETKSLIINDASDEFLLGEVDLATGIRHGGIFDDISWREPGVVLKKEKHKKMLKKYRQESEIRFYKWIMKKYPNDEAGIKICRKKLKKLGIDWKKIKKEDVENGQKMSLLKNNAKGIDLIIERDAGNEFRVLTGKPQYSMETWRNLRKLCDDAIRELRIEILSEGIETNELKCPCGKTATYICECGCLCCGEDPCIFDCGGSVIPLEEGLKRGIKPRSEMLYPNCSEAVMRIRTDSLTDEEYDKIVKFLNNCKKKDTGKWDPKTKLEKEIDEHWYDTYWDEKEIFGIKVIEINGDTPYNGGDWLTEKILDIAPGAKIEES